MVNCIYILLYKRLSICMISLFNILAECVACAVWFYSIEEMVYG